MLSKRSLRLVSLTGMVIFVLFFIRHNAESVTRSYVGKESSNLANDAKVESDINNIQEGIAETKSNAVVADTSNAVKNMAGPNGVKDSDFAAEVETYNAEAEYKNILSQSPIVVFSKSYCPFSTRLKNLLKEYEFDPIYTIVELDKHENGAELQKYIGSKTGRSTVPNVIINGISRGGSDEFAGLHEDNSLLQSLKTWAGSTLSVKKAAAAT
ncbi:glutaredoxin [Kluyveromyces lactis]|uniref:KLLA0E17733p n=1 Tax=Kluyveromyces lactis (strain ATCC 8585 / CBS 2359 / DSM 70799 / NBRC 1267 / NRRL Y-1140 / WM37) TaxID=284590 RepID=Q6CMT9_KLULA|nr:uncharacterized protein KLLA0_E17733g [Kluyveromyces lactis]CAG99837.1 KLLA0E17733p [Kluyveromyces lactis]|eukprot:XP_454750.1 uncharacterized protein KLLA0_E17733g [Kluyveromyces lactis]